MNDYFQPLQTGMGDTLPPEGTGPAEEWRIGRSVVFPQRE
jgi:hypothetical protein